MSAISTNSLHPVIQPAAAASNYSAKKVKVVGGRVDIPVYKFTVDKQGFRIPLKPKEVNAYLAEIAEKRQKLKASSYATQSAYHSDLSAKPRKSVDQLSSQEVEMAFEMLKAQQNQVLEPLDLKKLAEVQAKLKSKKRKDAS